MRKNIAEDKEKLKEKLSYIGLNLEKLPKFLTEFTPISFRPSRTYDDTSYKVYKYVDVNDIQILLTPTDRLTNISEKYKLAMPIVNYLDSKTQANAEYFTTFLKLLNDISLEEIQKVEEEQLRLNSEMPNQVKYTGNYAWQVFYSEVSDKYFMLVPTNEYNNAALFYLIKKQIESKKNRRKETIFIPISHQEYSGSYLVKSQIADLENYLWYFTKEWPNIFEVYDKKGKMTLKIVGKTNVYENIQSEYVITLKNKEEALEEYKLIKALFILATGLPQNYEFRTKINDEAALEFSFFNNTQEIDISYNDLAQFIQMQAVQNKMLISLEDKKVIEKQEKLKELKEIVEKHTEEYLSKQRQIATFLECKKTFFGKMKYYFSNKKREFKVINRNKAKESNENIETSNTKKEEQAEPYKQYTIEDLLDICIKLEARTKMVKGLKLDIKAQELKKINLERKIKNANIFLNEIELHKKSIFEFWKFTNKDELPSLNEGEEDEEKSKEKIGKIFNYNEDIEDIGKKIDEVQRRKLSKNETDSIFAVKYALTSMQILNKTKSDELTQKQKDTLEKELNKLKAEYEKDIDLIKAKDFDIFGGMSEDRTKVKIIDNKKHREVEKDKYKVLNITPKTELDIYIDTLRNYLKMIKEGLVKISAPLDMSIYLVKSKKMDDKNLNIFHLDQNKAIQDIVDEDEIYLYKINLKENMPIIFYSNIAFFDNFNKTLPVGMNLSDEVLVDLSEYKLEEIKKSTFKISKEKNEYTNNVVNVKVIEYDAKNKK